MKRLYRFPMRSANVGRLVPVLILATLLISMLPAFTPTGAGAQDGSEPTPVAEVQEQQVEGESAEPTETAEPVETAEPAQTAEPQAQGGVTTYIAEARACPPGFDLSAGDASAALANCVEPLAGIDFTLGSQNPAYPGDTRTTGGDGVAVWPDIPLGTGYSINESVPQGSGDPWVYCEVTGGPGADQYLYFPTAGGRMDIGLSDLNLANYAQANCRWFNVQSGDPALALTQDASAAAGAGEVHLTNYLCPVNFNTADSTLGALKASCTTAGEGISFTLKASTGGPQTATTNAQGAVIWTDVPSGQLTIAESIPEGIRYAQPYCSVAPVGNGPGSPDLSLVQSDGKTIKGGIAPGQALHCELFNVPMPESTLAIIPFLCPSDFPGSDMTLHALTVGCSIPGLNIEFTITTAEGEQLTGTTGSNGFIEWKNLPSGTVSIEQVTPPGYLAGPTYCDPAPPAGELDGIPWQIPNYDGDIVSYDIPDRYTLNCSVFYVWDKSPAAPTGADAYQVNLSTYLCPASLTFDTQEQMANDIAQCHGAAGWTYEYAGEGFAQDVTTDPVGATSFGQATAGPFTLTASTQEESRPVALWCASNGGVFARLQDADESVFYYTPAAGEVLNCQWFNVADYPEGTTVTITIEKYLCGPDYPETVVVEDWRAACTDPHPGVTFNAELYAGGEIASGTTGDDGTVSFQVEPGNVVILPTPPDSLATGYAWCGAGAAGATPAYVNAGRLSAGEYGMPLSNINPSLVYSCEWFTVPTEDLQKSEDGVGNVAVIKWRCPVQFDAAGASLEQLREACTTPQPGVTIGVSYASGESFTELTRLEKGPAVASFEGLPPGEVGIGEPGPNGHELQRVICSTGDVGQAGFGVVVGYMEYPVADGGIAATIETGKELSCEFFNVPLECEDAPPTAGMIYVDKRTCPPGFAAIDSSHVDVAKYCTSEAGVEFKVTQGETELVAVTLETGTAEFPNVAAGALRISEYPREGYDPPKVFCRATAEGSGATGELAPVTVDNWGITYDLRDGDYLECVWANMPAAATSADPAKVIFQQHVCPEGTGEYETLETLLNTCTLGPEGVKFTAGQPLATPQEGTTDASAGVVFSDVAPGFNQVNEVEGQGYKSIAAWCGYVGPSGVTQASRYSAQPLYLYLAGGTSVECGWFSVPYVEPVPIDVAINVSNCLPYYEFDVATLEFLSLNCTPKQGVDIQMAAGDGAYEQTVTTSVTGLAVFEEVPSGKLVMTEASPSALTVRVFCRTPGTGYSSVNFSADTAEYLASGSENVICYWFTIDTTYSRLTIYKYACPDGYIATGETYDAVLQACPTPLEGVRFDFDASGTNYDITDDEGVAGFNDIDPGLQTMIETLPPDYSGATVFCREVIPGQPKPNFTEVPVENLRVEQPLDGGNGLECHWFNTKMTYATVTIHKYGCHEGYLPQSNSYQAVLSKCATPLEGVSFTLGAPATELSNDTDASGTVSWENVAPGPLFISETPLSGYTDAVVYCAIHPEGGPQGQFELVAVDQLAIEREVAAGDALECYWFNYAHPSGPDTPSPTPTPIPTSTPTPGISTPTPEPDAPATLVLTTYLCPEGYDVYGAESDLIEDCEEATPGIEVSLADLGEDTATFVPIEIATTDEDGVVTFSGLEPGLWLLTESLPETTSTAFIASCTSDQRDLQEEPLFTPLTYLGPQGQIGIMLIAGETLACDSYAIPEETDDK